MSVLGWTWRDAALPDGYRSAPIHEMTSIFWANGRPGAKDKMRAQIQLADQLDAFLPVSPRQNLGLVDVASWNADQCDRILQMLENVANQQQLTARFEPEQKEPAQSWLRERAQKQKEMSGMRTLVRQQLEQLAPRDFIERKGQGCLLFDLLLEKGSIAEFASQLTVLRHDNLYCSFVGPLPTYSFAKVGATRDGN